MTLLVLAAGMGSRYGGLKQIDPFTEDGEFIIDSVEGEGTNVSIVLPIARQTTSGAENITTESEVTDNE